MTAILPRLRPTQLVLIGWTLLSFLLALLPTGVGGSPRAVNAVLFMTLGPGCAMLLVILRTLPVAVAAVVAIGTSLAILVLSSQALLIVGMWRPWGITGLVALTTTALTLLPTLREARDAT
ncbi:hypothetical protein [Micromonospora sp. IBHARD004]|uniref:hypothetical protein n=1 Tax=Micromonospora sp. IBHARD004 TaxID=3457764 RepID=UPI004058BCB3